MNFLKRFPLFMLMLCGMAISSNAEHNLGGEISYIYKGNNLYDVSVHIYQDCRSGGNEYKSFLFLAIYRDGSSIAMDTLESFAPIIDTLSTDVIDSCLSQISNDYLCVSRGTYLFKDVFLPPTPGGYHLVHQVCCRPHGIDNLRRSGNDGITITTTIADAEWASLDTLEANSSPVFNEFPPVIVCKDRPFTINFAATDLDGDSLAYSLCPVLDGHPNGELVPKPPSPPPFKSVRYLSQPNGKTYSWQDPIDATQGVYIHPQSGLFTGTPIRSGTFALGICVNEHRGGKRITTVRRDIQLRVVECGPRVVLDSLLPVSPPTVCIGEPLNFSMAAKGATNYIWDFGNGETLNGKFPKKAFDATGTYNIRGIAYTDQPYCADTAFTTVTVYTDSVKSAFDYQVLPPCGSNQVAVTNKSIDADSIYWRFGDGTDASEEELIHQFPSGGIWEIVLHSINEDKCIAHDSSIAVVELDDVIPLVANVTIDTLYTNCDSTLLQCTSSGTAVTNKEWTINGNVFARDMDTITIAFTGDKSIEAALQVSDTGSCTIPDTTGFSFEVLPKVKADFIFVPPACFGRDAYFESTSSNGSQYDWQIEGNTSLLSDENFIFSFDTTGYFHVQLKVTSDASCNGADSIAKPILVRGGSAIPDFKIQDSLIFLDSILEIENLSSGNIDQYTWLVDNQLLSTDSSFSWLVMDTGWHSICLEVVDSFGCASKVCSSFFSSQLVHEGIGVPNAFTPDGDNLNDFLLVNGSGVQSLRFRVFDRVGQMVFESLDQQQGWDGTLNGRRLPIGVYLYEVVAVFYSGDKQTLVGNVTLIR